LFAPKVVSNSPGARAGLSPFFDFIFAVNDHVLDKEDSTLAQVLSSNLEKEVELFVYNSKTNSIRKVQLVPSLQWGGHGIVGISTRFCSVAATNEHVWHVLDIHPNSPAAEAGLVADLDYIVGAPDLLFSDSEDLFALVQSNVGLPVQLYVYNLYDDAVRLVTLKPRKDWGGVGCLGCGVGYGLLHRIARDRKAALAQHGIILTENPPADSSAAGANPLSPLSASTLPPVPSLRDTSPRSSPGANQPASSLPQSTLPPTNIPTLQTSEAASFYNNIATTNESPLIHSPTAAASTLATSPAILHRPSSSNQPNISSFQSNASCHYDKSTPLALPSPTSKALPKGTATPSVTTYDSSHPSI